MSSASSLREAISVLDTLALIVRLYESDRDSGINRLLDDILPRAREAIQKAADSASAREDA